MQKHNNFWRGCDGKKLQEMIGIRASKTAMSFSALMALRKRHCGEVSKEIIICISFGGDTNR